MEDIPSDVLSMVFHDHVDEIVDRCCLGRWLVRWHKRVGIGTCCPTVFISHQNLAVQDLIVTQHVVDHLLVQVLRRSLECDFHSAGLLGLQVDVPADWLDLN